MPESECTQPGLHFHFSSIKISPILRTLLPVKDSDKRPAGSDKQLAGSDQRPATSEKRPVEVHRNIYD